jgi:hypothetical protein
MRWAVLALARSRTSPTGRLSTPRSTIAEIARDVDDEIRRAHAFRPEIGFVRGAHDGYDDPVRAQRLPHDANERGVRKGTQTGHSTFPLRRLTVSSAHRGSVFRRPRRGELAGSIARCAQMRDGRLPPTA